MAKLKDLAEQVGELKPEEGKSLKRSIQDAAGVYDGRSDKGSKYPETDIVKAVALYKLFQNFEAASRESGIPASTIRQWVTGERSVLSKVGNLENKVADAYNLLVDNSIFLMTEAQQQIHKRLPGASAAQAATIFGILSDKVRYMTEGKREQAATSLHINVGGLSAEDQAAILTRALQRAEEREAIDAEFTTVEAETDEDEPRQMTEEEEEKARQKKLRSLQRRQAKIFK